VLQTSEQEWSFTPAEWVAYKAGHRRNQSVFWGLLAMGYLVLAGVMIGLTLYVRSHGPAHLRTDALPALIEVVLGGIAFTAMTVLYFLEFSEFRRNRSLHSEEGREQIRKEIRKLTLKLTS
jgi:hypothetical protein